MKNMMNVSNKRNHLNLSHLYDWIINILFYRCFEVHKQKRNANLIVASQFFFHHEWNMESRSLEYMSYTNEN